MSIEVCCFRSWYQLNIVVSYHRVVSFHVPVTILVSFQVMLGPGLFDVSLDIPMLFDDTPHLPSMLLGKGRLTSPFVAARLFHELRANRPTTPGGHPPVSPNMAGKSQNEMEFVWEHDLWIYEDWFVIAWLPEIPSREHVNVQPKKNVLPNLAVWQKSCCHHTRPKPI